jgi:hypothetical protein
VLDSGPDRTRRSPHLIDSTPRRPLEHRAREAAVVLSTLVLRCRRMVFESAGETLGTLWGEGTACGQTIPGAALTASAYCPNNSFRGSEGPGPTTIRQPAERHRWQRRAGRPTPMARAAPRDHPGRRARPHRDSVPRYASRPSSRCSTDTGPAGQRRSLVQSVDRGSR